MSDLSQRLKHAQSLINAIPDFPKPGILFQDIFPIFRHPGSIQALIDGLVELLIKDAAHGSVDVIVGLDARGFLLGPMLACRLGCAFVPVRKRGKLPGQVIQVAYEKEYGVDYFEMQADAIKAGQNVVILDDLLATGGSAQAAIKLVEQLGGCVRQALFVVELTALKGGERLSPCPVASLFQYDD